jgi:hypothetical protein
MAVVRGLALRYVVRAGLLVMIVTTGAASVAEVPLPRPPARARSIILVHGQGRCALGSPRARVVIVLGHCRSDTPWPVAFPCLSHPGCI